VLTHAPEYRLGALVATMAGVTFWVYRMHFDLTSANRIRSGLLAFVCVALSVLTRLWIWVT
jgi:high-affinity Fe2+/Pb2+ permease